MEILAPGALRQRTQVYKIDCFRFFRPLHRRRSVLHLFYPAADYQFRHQFCHAGHRQPADADDSNLSAV